MRPSSTTCSAAASSSTSTSVVRNGVRASRPGYGLKELEAFLDFRRQAEIQDGGTSIIVFEQWMQTRDPALLAQIDEYNREDCIATLLLRDWLLERRAEALARFGPFPLPEPEGAEAASRRRRRRARSFARTLLERGRGARGAAARLPRPRAQARLVGVLRPDRDDAGRARRGRRVDRPAGAASASPSRSGPLARVHAHASRRRSTRSAQGQSTIDPATRKSPGEILEVDREARRLVLKRGPSFEDVPLPEALVPGRPYDTHDQEDALERLGRSLLAGDGRYPALESILRREPFDRPVQTSDLDEMKELVLSLDGRHLVIQGPPGSGKTWTSGRLIAHLLAQGKRVGVASTSHKAIHNLLDAVEDAAAELGRRRSAG